LNACENPLRNPRHPAHRDAEKSMSDKEKYEQILLLLSDAEREARNRNWMTSGTAARRAAELAYKFGNEELHEDTLRNTEH
jgi:hypothetical protein